MTKHIYVDCHFVSDKIKNKEVLPIFISTRLQVVDVLTKGIPKSLHYNSFLSLAFAVYKQCQLGEGGVKELKKNLQDRNTSNGGATGQVYKVTNDGNPNKNGLEFVMKEAPTSYANKLSPTSFTKANLQKLDAKVPNDADFDIWLPLDLVHKVNDRMKDSLYGYFIGKRLAFPVFSSTKGVDLVLTDGPWMIHEVPIFLNKWSPFVSLLKEELSRVLVWVKFHDVPLVVYTSDGLSLIAKKIDACNDFSDNLIVVVLNLEGPGYSKETICVECDPKMAPLAGKKKVSTTGTSSRKKTGKTNALTSSNGTFSLSNLFEVLNVDNLGTEEVD
ncbi:zinc knuckle CX2CX4HX4C containing protein [Tanacetum coccineum]